MVRMGIRQWKVLTRLDVIPCGNALPKIHKKKRNFSHIAAIIGPSH